MEVTLSKIPKKKHLIIVASIKLMLQKGYYATTIDEICSEAGVTKGSYFHYFKNKEDAAKIALNYFTMMQKTLFDEAPYHHVQDPWEKLQLFLDYYLIIADNEQLPKSCLATTFIQELADEYPDIRSMCEHNYNANAQLLEKLIAECLIHYTPNSPLNAKQISHFFTSLHQGSLLYARAKQDNAVVKENIEQFRQYVSLLFLK